MRCTVRTSCERMTCGARKLKKGSAARRSSSKKISGGIGKSNGLFHRLRPPTPCHPAATLPAAARAGGRPARPTPADGQRWRPPAGRRRAPPRTDRTGGWGRAAGTAGAARGDGCKRDESLQRLLHKLAKLAGQLAVRGIRRPTKCFAESSAQLVWIEGFEHAPLGSPRPDVPDDIART